jgi:hypothetical protein
MHPLASRYKPRWFDVRSQCCRTSYLKVIQDISGSTDQNVCPNSWSRHDPSLYEHDLPERSKIISSSAIASE